MSREKFCLPPPRPKEERDRVEAMVRAGETYQAIHEATGIPKSTIRNWTARFKFKQPKAEPEPLMLVPTTDEEPDIPESLPEQIEQYEGDMRRAALTFSRYVSGLPGETITLKSQHIKHGDGVARKALQIDREIPRTVIQIGVLAQSPAKQAQQRVLAEKQGVEVLDIEN